MKTKLILLLVLLSSWMGQAQVNFSESFETGTFPVGWTNNGAALLNNFQLASTGTHYIQMQTFIGSNRTLTTSNMVSDGGAITVSVKYRKFPDIASVIGIRYFIGASTTPVVIVSVGLGTSITGGYVPLSGIIPAGAVPAGSNVRFQIFVFGQAGEGNSSFFFDDFIGVQDSAAALAGINVNLPTLTSTTATINYGLNANNNATTSVVRYGLTSTSLSSQVAGFSSNGTTLVNGVADIAGLLAGTQYFYRVEASNSQGIASSSIYSFTTPLPLIAFSNLIATAITATTATVSVDVANVCPGAVYRLQRSISAAFIVSVVDTEFPTGGTSGTKNHNITGLLPNTQYFFRFYSNPNTACNPAIVISAVANFTTLTPVPTITNTASSATSSAAAISYSLNANGLTTNSLVKYGLTSGNLSSQVIGSSATGTTNSSGNASISGLTANTQYFYSVEATNSAGTTTGPILNFTTLAIGAPIAEYNFNNSYNNINGTTPFANNSGTTFATGRDGVTANGAINIANIGSTATILGLPYGASQRTVSMWVKLNSFSLTGFNFLYHYGTNGAGNGTFINPTTITHFALNPNHSVAATSVVNIWYHYVVMYDGTNSKIYRNGALLNSSPATVATGNNLNTFRLGLSETGSTGSFNGTIDDLKIYNYALTDSQVSNLFNFNSVAVPSPSISSVSATGINSTSATIAYSLNANSGETTSVVKYGVTSGNLTSTATGFVASGNTTTPGTASLTNLLPSTQYFYRVEATNVGGTTQGALLNFTTLSPPTAPTIGNISVSSSATTAFFFANASSIGMPTTLILRYGLASNALAQTLTGNAFGNEAFMQSGINNLTPNTVYYYQFEATNAVGTTTTVIASFSTPPATAVAEYSFDNTAANLLGNNPFSVLQGAASTFVADRNLNANNAVSINNSLYRTSIINLPTANGSRTVSLWIKLNIMQPINGLFRSGGVFPGNGFRGSLTATSVDFVGIDQNISVNSANVVNTWYHFVYSYDGVNLKIYKNGALIANEPKNLISSNEDNNFSLGQGDTLNFNGAIDDLKLYNYAVTDAQALNLFTSNSLIANVIPAFNQVAPICLGATLADLPLISTNGITGIWSPPLNNTSTTIYTFTPNAGQNASVTTLTIVVNTAVTPTTSTTSATCSANGTASIANFNSALSYVSTPSGATVGNAGLITGTAGIPYTFTAAIGTCISSASIAVTIPVQLAAPAAPTTATTAATCSANGTATISNYNAALTYTSTPASATVGIAGLITGTAGIAYTFTAAIGTCISSASIAVTIPLQIETPSTPTGLASQTFVQGATIASLVVTPSNVIWYASTADANSGNNPLPATTLLVNLVTYYAVNVVATCRSTALAVTVSITLNTDTFYKARIVLYPNPVVDILNIDTTAEIKSIEIFNIQGQKVLSATQKQINLLDLASGMYLIRIQDTENGITIKKFMKK